VGWNFVITSPKILERSRVARDSRRAAPRRAAAAARVVLDHIFLL
jgi:hypothetical protein